MIVRDPFQSLFPIDPQVLSAVTESMRESGFDEAQPVVCWRDGDDDVVIDGHTRKMAAEAAGVEPGIVRHEFADERAALEYAIARQRDRRNLSREELAGAIARAVVAWDQRNSHGGDQRASDTSTDVSTSRVTANKVGTSSAQVERIRTVLDHAPQEVQEQLLAGKTTINSAYQDAIAARDEKRQAEPEQPGPAKFNQVNDNIGWAKWSWNPVTGCLHNCEYCYARDIANRFYAQKFEPTFLPERLDAPANTKLPKAADVDADPSWRNVFTCSMADLFGKWVPQEWIDQVLAAVRAHQEWNFLMLTKFPQRLAEIEWPENAWIGTSVDRQHRVRVAEKAFADCTAGLKWLSCEPLLEPLKFDSLEMFDWVVIGSQTSSSGAPALAPHWDWVVDLYQQARDAGCKVFLKHNLFGAADGVGPGISPVREYPWDAR